MNYWKKFPHYVYKQIMFYVRQFPLVEGKPGTTPLSDAIKALLEDLASRKYTGNAARDRLLDIVSSVNINDREVLRRIINRDLECGAGTTLPNRVWKKLIPEQPQCLATPFSEKALRRIISLLTRSLKPMVRVAWLICWKH